MLFLKYLRRHYKIIILITLFIAVFALVFSLYDLPTEAVLYAAGLCLFLGTVLFAIGYIRFLSHHRILSELVHRIALTLDDLPAPRGAIEQDYRKLIETLFAEKTRIESEADSRSSDLVDYYTMWVHQIKTPIAAIGLMLQADEHPLNAALSAELFKIEQYVEMVLQYLRLDNSASDFVIRRIKLDGIVRQAVRKYAKLFILKKIILDYDEINLVVLTDEKWLCFVIEQVLSNSLKYTSEGRISVYTEDTTLVIEDTGIGIQAEDLPRVFEKGYTGYNGRADKKSTGIGLYLCKRILEKLGHTIAIESAVGKGTKVSIGLDSANQVFE
jgi:signal transduction histidine kinase